MKTSELKKQLAELVPSSDVIVYYPDSGNLPFVNYTFDSFEFLCEYLEVDSVDSDNQWVEESIYIPSVRREYYDTVGQLEEGKSRWAVHVYEYEIAEFPNGYRMLWDNWQRIRILWAEMPLKQRKELAAQTGLEPEKLYLAMHDQLDQDCAYLDPNP